MVGKFINTIHEGILMILEAISTLLQTGLPPPPTAILSTSQNPPTSRDIPPVILSPIPHVESSAFKDYLREVGSLFDTVQHTRLESKDLFHQDISSTKGDEAAPYGGWKTSVPKRGQLAPTPLSTIPSLYFAENFHLENPRVFDVVSEDTEVVRQPLSTIGEGDNIAANGYPQPTRKTLATYTILQEKLSWYMDTVEIHLGFSISQASASFFAALGSLHELQIEATDSVAKIQTLRKALAYLDKEMVLRGLEIINSQRRRDNLTKLGEATKQLQCVLSGASHCEELVSSGQLETAMQHISYVEQLASGTLDPKIGGELQWLLPNPFIRLTDLRRLHALGGVLRDIDQLHLRIGEGYESRLLNVLLGDLRRHVSNAPPRDTLARWTKRVRSATDASASTSMMMAEKLREELIPVLQGLDHSHYLAVASTMFREAVIREMKSLIRQHLPSSTDEESELSASTRASGRRPSQQEMSSILSRDLRALSPEDAEAFFVKVYCGIGEALRRLSVQVKVSPRYNERHKDFKQRTYSRPRPGKQGQSGFSFTQPFDRILLEQAVGKAQSEIIKVMRVRTEQTVRLGLTGFLRYFTLNRLFVNECEAVSGHSGETLKGVVNNQIHDFILVLHEAEKQKLGQKMESEKWERIDFKAQDALILAHIVQSMTTDPPAWLSCTDVSNAGLEASELNLQKARTPAELTSAPKQNKKDPTLAVIEGEKFTLVDSTALALRGIEQYTILLALVPGMVKDISTLLLEYLKLYNSRTQQLILGAGAKITAGLTNINTKHLALASQSLSFFIALIPYVRECVRRRPSITGSNMAEYDRLKCLFQDHQSTIHDKLVDIMSFHATVYIRDMNTVKWDDEDEVRRNVSPHMETLTKEALTLHRVLSKYLSALNVSMIVRQVLANYKEQWSKAFEAAAIQTEAGKARLLRDAELLKTKLGKIDGGQELGAHIVHIVKVK
ncbi:uncharacterized protein N7459_006355 [Penicillium hispanicum]|uniref:uncharacterized protein n=1 Tax=Penicillium hispanicum TaxID=1080232 RepID=UPI00253F9CF6|nr:uncharacterized protein N7459_006355 [Penicillium hispanicum]KAJ5577391.1 hypothetical protein N7459_006355 [Penicillium hispanicum]